MGAPLPCHRQSPSVAAFPGKVAAGFPHPGLKGRTAARYLGGVDTGTVLYRRATFVTHLPVAYLYTPAHCWLARVGEDPAGMRWRVGYTKFALRMLGEVVDVQWERLPGQPVEPGDVLGSIEGFKALSDIYCAGRGRFAGGNPALQGALAAVNEQPYDAGWLYEFTGEPDPRAMDINGYRDLLDATIDRILERQQQQDPEFNA